MTRSGVLSQRRPELPTFFDTATIKHAINLSGSEAQCKRAIMWTSESRTIGVRKPSGRQARRRRMNGVCSLSASCGRRFGPGPVEPSGAQKARLVAATNFTSRTRLAPQA